MNSAIAKILILLAILPNTLAASEPRPPERGGMTKSLGLPDPLRLHIGFASGAYRPTEDIQLWTEVEIGATADLFGRAVSAISTCLEAYAGNRNDVVDGGVRWLVEIPHAHVAAGVDINFLDEESNLIFTFSHPIIRGGLLQHGGNFFVNWLPAKGHSFQAGITIPLFQPSLGKTRARRGHVTLGDRYVVPVECDDPEPELAEAVENVGEAMRWINIMNAPFIDFTSGRRGKALERIERKFQAIKDHMAARDALYPEGHTSSAEIEVLHSELARAFTIAVTGLSYGAGESVYLGKEVASRAKEIALEEVIFPYNRLLGQVKKNDSTLDLATYAMGSFDRWLHTSSAVTPERVESVRFVFSRFLQFIEENRKLSKEECKDSRIVWIPLQYALTPDQHDTQAELDALVERASGERFKEGNWIWYLVNEQFHHEVSRMIHEARDYHVLWIHDIRGVDAEKEPDELSFLMIKDSWLAALTDRISEYDETGKIPVFMIFLDQFFYEANRGSLWMNLLEDPLNYELVLPAKYSWMQEEIEQAQERLRAAVAGSELLQYEIRQYGQQWLENVVKVHVNITNPSDPSFWTSQIVPVIGLPDNLIRDHRKISFFDIAEEDPYRGRAIYTGMGVGEHYAGATWEDRAIMSVGPALLSLKYSARRLLLNQGFKQDEIPWPLRIREKPKDYDEIIERFVEESPEGRTSKHHLVSRAFQIHNQTGYNPKPINVMRATTYTLMPPGSVLKIPDSLWNASFFASILMGNALRGGRVFIIAPSLACAPSNGFPQMSRAYSMLSKLIIFRRMMSEELEACGGEFRTGLYDPDVDVGDLRGRIREIRQGFRSNPFLMDLYNFDEGITELMDRIDSLLVVNGYEADYLIDGDILERPALHMKTGFFASKEAWEKLMARPEWLELYRIYTQHRLRQLGDDAYRSDIIDLQDALVQTGVPMIRNFLDELNEEERERVIYYLHVGSANMNYRSMIQDGETMFVVSGLQSIFSLIDFIELMGMTTWVEDQETLDELLPPYNRLQKLIGWMIRIMV